MLLLPGLQHPNELMYVDVAGGAVELVQPERASPPHKVVATARPLQDGKYAAQLSVQRALAVKGTYAAEEHWDELGVFGDAQPSRTRSRSPPTCCSARRSRNHSVNEQAVSRACVTPLLRCPFVPVSCRCRTRNTSSRSAGTSRPIRLASAWLICARACRHPCARRSPNPRRASLPCSGGPANSKVHALRGFQETEVGLHRRLQRRIEPPRQQVPETRSCVWYVRTITPFGSQYVRA